MIKNIKQKIIVFFNCLYSIYTERHLNDDVSVYYRLVITDPGTRQSIVKYTNTIKEALELVPDYRFETCFEYMLFKVDPSKKEELFINLNIFKNGINLNRRLQEQYKNRKELSCV